MRSLHSVIKRLSVYDDGEKRQEEDADRPSILTIIARDRMGEVSCSSDDDGGCEG